MECDLIKKSFDLENTNDKRRKQIEQHLEQCSDCRREFDIYKEMMSQLKNIQPLELPNNFHNELMQSIKKQAQSKTFSWNRLATMVAGLLVVIVSVAMIDTMAIYDKKPDAATGVGTTLQSIASDSSRDNGYTGIETTAGIEGDVSVIDFSDAESYTEASLTGEQVMDETFVTPSTDGSIENKRSSEPMLQSAAVASVTEDSAINESEKEKQNTEVGTVAREELETLSKYAKSYNIDSAYFSIDSLSDSVGTTYYFQVSTDNFDTAFQAVQELAEAHNGRVRSSSQYNFSDDDMKKNGNVAIIVPAQAVSDVEASLKYYGTITSESKSTKDYGAILKETKNMLDYKLAELESINSIINNTDDNVKYSYLLSDINTVIQSCYSTLEAIQNSCSYSVIDVSIVNK